MTLPVTSALAPDFAWVTNGVADITVVFPGPTGSVDIIVPSGTYRMCLAPSASDFLRVVQTAINDTIANIGGSETVAITLNASGVVTLFFSAAITSLSVAAASTAWRLGLTETAGVVSGATSLPIAGARPVWHLALFASITGGVWQPTQTGGAERLSDGRVYSVGSTSTSWQRTAQARFVPWNPTVRASYSTGATSLWPDDAYLAALGSTATDREWSVLDVLQGARNAVCGLALGTWQTVRTSTVLRYDRVYVAPATLLSPEVGRLDDAWEAFVELPLSLSRPATSPTETRA